MGQNITRNKKVLRRKRYQKRRKARAKAAKLAGIQQKKHAPKTA
jgi:hypothetical protein